MLDELAGVFFYLIILNIGFHWNADACYGGAGAEMRAAASGCTVELRCAAAAVRNVCHCAAYPAPLPLPHIHSEWGEEESLARCGRLYQFQIVYRIIFSDSTHRRGPKMNLRRERRRPHSLESSITLKRRRRRRWLSKSFRSNQFCNLRDRRWLMERSPVWVKTYCFLYSGRGGGVCGVWITSVRDQYWISVLVAKAGTKCRQCPGCRWIKSLNTKCLPRKAKIKIHTHKSTCKTWRNTDDNSSVRHDWQWEPTENHGTNKVGKCKENSLHNFSSICIVQKSIKMILMNINWVIKVTI